MVAASFGISPTSVAGEIPGCGLAALPAGIGVGQQALEPAHLSVWISRGA